VLGPPRDPKYLNQLGEHGSPDLYEMAAGLSNDVAAAAAGAMESTVMEDDAQPFEPKYGHDAEDPSVRARWLQAYDAQDEQWRRIDHEWLSVAANFALQLDNYTNNTSLVLAIELGGKVLLFAADAQLGNWLSWHDVEWHVKDGGSTKTVKASDLLKRTVFYKVGHHSSHNATATQKGLELMTHEDLVAFVPLYKTVAVNKKWPMPARALHKRLLEQADGCVVHSDEGWPATVRPEGVSDAEWKRWRANHAAANISDAKASELYIDYWIA
jgi:hypothetical protein